MEISKTQDVIVRGVFYTGFALAVAVSTVWWIIGGQFRDDRLNPRHYPG